MTEAAAKPAVPVTRRTRLVWGALAVYGVTVAVIASVALDARLPAAQQLFLQGDRLEGAQIALNGLAAGRTPLVGRRVTNQSSIGAHLGEYTVVGLADDPGWYVYDPYVTRWSHQHDPRVVLRWSYVVLFALLLAVLPLSFYALTGSWAAAVLAPIIVATQFHFLDNTDIYWLNAWVVLLLLPIVFAVYRLRWSRWSIAVLIGASVVGSWATSIRSHAGLPVAIAALTIGVLRQTGRWRKVALAAAVVVAYLSVYPLAFEPVFHARDAAAKRYDASPPTPPGKSLSDVYPRSHLTWHNVYIGLGYLPNPYGIRWLDGIGYEHAQRIDPNVTFLTKRYDRDVRHLFFRILRKDPGLVWRNIEVKTRFEVGQAVHRFGWALLLLPAIFGLGRSRRREFALYLALLVPAVVLTLVPPVLTVPLLFYSVGFFATAGLVWLLAATWFVGVTVPEVAPRARAWLAARNAKDIRWSRSHLVLGGATVLAAMAVALAPPIQYAGNAAGSWPPPALEPTPLSPASSLAGTAVATWHFGRSLQAAWKRANGDVTLTRRDGRAIVTTGPGHFEYQLLGPSRKLGPGRYYLELTGAVRSGGLDLGVLDVRKQRWIAQTTYDSTQSFGRGRMKTGFTLTRPAYVQPILSNWRSSDGVSVWELGDASLAAERAG